MSWERSLYTLSPSLPSVFPSNPYCSSLASLTIILLKELLMKSPRTSVVPSPVSSFQSSSYWTSQVHTIRLITPSTSRPYTFWLLKSTDHLCTSLTLPSLYLSASLPPLPVCILQGQCSVHCCSHLHPWGSVFIWGFHSACCSLPLHLRLQPRSLSWVSASCIQSYAGPFHLGVHSFFELANTCVFSSHVLLNMMKKSIPPAVRCYTILILLPSLCPSSMSLMGLYCSF